MVGLGGVLRVELGGRHILRGQQFFSGCSYLKPMLAIFPHKGAETRTAHPHNGKGLWLFGLPVRATSAFFWQTNGIDICLELAFSGPPHQMPISDIEVLQTGARRIGISIEASLAALALGLVCHWAALILNVETVFIQHFPGK